MMNPADFKTRGGAVRLWTGRKQIISITSALLFAGQCIAEPVWPQFRGPNGQGVSTLTAPPSGFGLSSNLLWSIAMPPGHSSPVIAGGRIFLTSFDGGKLHTLAVDQRSGKLLWRKAAPAGVIEPVHEFASPAAPSPLATEDRVVVHFGSCGLLCYDFAGRELWSVPLPTPKSTYGTSSSPIRVGSTAVIVLDSNDKTSRLLAVNLADGSTAWETARPLSGAGWATPMLWEHGGGSEIIVPGARRLISYDSRSGRDLWWMDGYSPETISVPVAGEGLLFVSSSGLAGPPTEGFESMSWAEMAKLDRNGDGVIQKAEVPADFRFTLRPELPPDHPGRYVPGLFAKMFDGVDGNRDGTLTEAEFTAFVKQWGARAKPSLKAIRPGGSGDVAKSHVAWQLAKGIPEIPSPLFHRGRIYLVRDGGFLTCAKAATGELLFQERVGAEGSYCASPVAVGNLIFLASHNGVLVCIDAAEGQLHVLARNNLGERIWATPALADGTIYVRTEKHLYAFSESH
jgi:outer membrane protein assembly factor BamB